MVSNSERYSNQQSHKSKPLFQGSNFYTMISSLMWLRKGVAKENPEKYELSEEEYKKFSETAQFEIEESKKAMAALGEEPEHREEMEVDNDPELAKYNLQDYDKEEDRGIDFVFGNVKGVEYHGDELGSQDPYITFDGESEDDLEDEKIKISDLIIVAAKTEENISNIEVHIYEEGEDNLYCHHDIMLPSFPLCLEWIQSAAGKSGNLLAVGTFEPEIEIWDLDVIDAVYPVAILGKEESTSKKSSSSSSKSKSKKKKANDKYHVDSVMSLNWNRNHSNILASGSADNTVKIWDLNSTTAVHSFNHHKDKVQAIQWNPIETSVLATGSYDKTVAVFDSRAPDSKLAFTLSADVESLKWCPHNSNWLLVSDESGRVSLFDMKSSTNPLFTLSAHNTAATAIDWNPFLPNTFLTASSDKSVKLWDTSSGEPACLMTKQLDLGKIFTASFSMDSPYLVAAAGSNGIVEILNFNENQHFQRKITELLAVSVEK